MSGNNGSVPGPLDLLGQLTADPVSALDQIVKKPYLGSGFVMVGLAVLGQTLTATFHLDQGMMGLFKQAGSHFFGHMLTWAGPTMVLHFFSSMSGKKGSLGSFLALSGWAFVVFWPTLALRLFVPHGPSWALMLTLVLNAFFNMLFLGIVWWGLQRVYGWTKIQSGFVLLGSAGVYGLVGHFFKG